MKTRRSIISYLSRDGQKVVGGEVAIANMVSPPCATLMQTEDMTCIIRPLQLEDEPFLWEMLYQALYVPKGQSVLPREVVYLPELARYVQGWGREGDCGFLASDAIAGQSIGAIWLRLLVGENKGYGYVDDNMPELIIAVFPEYRGQGVGTQLLSHLFASDCGRTPVSLSVSLDNPAVRLYERFRFEVVSKSHESLTMRRNYNLY